MGMKKHKTFLFLGGREVLAMHRSG